MLGPLRAAERFCFRYVGVGSSASSLECVGNRGERQDCRKEETPR